MAIIVDSGRRIPFLRGMLTHYLLEQGFSFREAYQVADRVRSSIQKQKKVPAGRMIDLVHTHARELFADRPVGDGVFWAPRSRQILVEDDLGTRPFSKDHLSDSLAITGVDESQAYRIAERIEGDFIQNDSTVVSREDILKATLKMLRSDSGDAFAERYGIWNRFRKGGQAIPLIVLIGGGTGVGKTTVGVALANLLRVSRVASTDEIRQVMRLMISSDLMPELQVSSYTAWEAIPAPADEAPDPVIYGFREQAARVSVGVRATIARAIDENVSLIVDGVHLMPDLLELEAFSGKALFIHLNLYLTDLQQFTDRFESRGKKAFGRTRHRYVKSLDQIMKIQQHILDVGDSAGVPSFENADLDETVQSISLLIMDTLRKGSKGG
ncbi:MAG: hypothetical protein OXU79_08975 [Gemmatimonadota bacterium]|nr:hypothetical protein [Gemmatimonadota bacterium]